MCVCDTARKERLSEYAEILCLNKLLYHKLLLVFIMFPLIQGGAYNVCVWCNLISY